MSSIGHNGGPPIDRKPKRRWVAIETDIENHPIVGFGKPGKPANPKRDCYSKAEAWESILFMASAKPWHIEVKGRLMTLNRGDFLGAYSFLAEKWNWTPMAVRWFIRKLEENDMLASSVHVDEQSKTQNRNKRRNNQTSVRTVCNYNRIQHGWAGSHNQNNKRTTSEQQANNKPATTNIQVTNTIHLLPRARAMKLALFK